MVIFLTLLLAWPMHWDRASAQEPAPRRNLLDMIFGGGRRYIDPPPPMREVAPRRQRQREQRPPRRNRAPAARASAPRPAPPPAPAKPEPVEKLENARSILVVGDFLAGGLGSELQTAFEQSPGVVVEERSNGSSGLVRQDYYNWPEQLPTALDEVKPALVVVMIGANDRQQMKTQGGQLDFPADDWFREYERRVREIGTIVTDRGIPLLWVGLPSFQSPSLMRDAVKLNGIYRAEMSKIGGEFVDIWDGFVDEEGKFVITGSDMNGQQARLRGSDGIGFTTAGKRKLAFYVEKYARRHLGEMASPELVELDASNLPELQILPPSPTAAVPVQPISLTDPELDGGSELLGAAPLPAPIVESPRDMLVKRGELPPAPTGRIDDYRRSEER
ncbi:SGNH/GDSL hydrolase family protein [Rhizobium halophilum]|uniref:SGNH/GDSL hydrolase family protein n=1 Tax=Rhizobium halophilum TaxID=2846852 RepID=UPI00374C9A36